MPLWQGGSVLKRWRYVGIYTRDLILCVGHARIGPIPRRWWAIAEPDGTLHGNGSTCRGGVSLDGSGVRVDAPGAHIDLVLHPAQAVETASPVGRRGNYIWTAKRAGVEARGVVVIHGEEHRIDGPHAFIDDSAGYHARHTMWKWSAGLGRAEDGRRVAWNLVTGVHDAPAASERTLWVDGHPSELGPVTFAADLSEVSFAEGGRLHFTEWSSREERTDMLVVRSTYRQPFGTFSGRLPGGAQLAEGYGVMEAHDVWW